MEEVGTDNPLHAARHEAGHAIVAVRKGFHPRSLRLWREDGRWVGDCDCGEVRLKTKMKLGFGAGGGSTDTTDAENHIAQAVAVLWLRPGQLRKTLSELPPRFAPTLRLKV